MVEITEKISAEEEIKKLEQQLEQKKRELAGSGISAKEEKEMFREVLKEHIESFKPPAPQFPLSPAPGVSPVSPAAQDQDTEADASKQQANEAVVRMLIEKAMTGTIEDAVKEAQKVSPYMVDELHDHLIDDVYQKLISSRKVKQL